MGNQTQVYQTQNHVSQKIENTTFKKLQQKDVTPKIAPSVNDSQCISSRKTKNLSIATSKKEPPTNTNSQGHKSS